MQAALRHVPPKSVQLLTLAAAALLCCAPAVQMSVCSAMHGNKLYTLQPNLHEQLVELQVMSLTLPDDIERMKAAKRRDQEQVRVHEEPCC
jgi:creatinine amidohydrolase/Fe(II)-dependent formamide hydrolase-like protein